MTGAPPSSRYYVKDASGTTILHIITLKDAGSGTTILEIFEYKDASGTTSLHVIKCKDASGTTILDIIKYKGTAILNIIICLEPRLDIPRSSLDSIYVYYVHLVASSLYIYTW